jgi:hypothetical protein
MKKANRSDKKLVKQIIAETFNKNPGVNWLLKKSGNHTKKILRLADYVFIKAQIRDGVFISDNEKGVAICYKFNNRKFSLTEHYYELRFVLSSTNLLRIGKVLKRESYRKNMRPKSGKYLYFWFLGVLPGGEKAVYDLRDGIFNLAKNLKLPIYLETAMEKNKLVYERYGFKTFHFWYNEKENIKFWFMRQEPEEELV